MSAFHSSSCSVFSPQSLRYTRAHLLKRLQNTKLFNLLLLLEVISLLSDDLKILFSFLLMMLFAFNLRSFISMCIRFKRDEGVVGGYFCYWLFCWWLFWFYWFLERWHCFYFQEKYYAESIVVATKLLRSFKKSYALLESMLFGRLPFWFTLAKRVETSDWATCTSLHSLDSSFSNNISWIMSNRREVIFLLFIWFFRSPK